MKFSISLNQKGRTVLVLGVVLLITVCAFYPALKNGFILLDDNTHVYDNPLIRHLDPPHLARMFQSTVNNTYIPLTLLSFAIEYHYFGNNPFVFHLTNLLLHLGVVGLIFWFARRNGFSIFASGLSALIFAIHPIHVEPVVWITSRKDVLYALFYLLALHTYISYCRHRAKMDIPRFAMMRLYILTIFCGFLSLLAKPMALSLPIVLCVCDFFWKRPFNKTLILEKIPFLIYTIPLAWTTYALHIRNPASNLWEAPLIWIWTFTFYLKKFAMPFDLLVLYELPRPVSLLHPSYLTALVIFITFFYLLYRFRTQRLWVFGSLFYVASLFFIFRFDNRWDLTIVADRFMYLPSLGFCLILGFYADRFFLKTKDKALREVMVGFLVVIIFLAAQSTYAQCKLWGNEKNLWEAVIRRHPSSVAYSNLGNYHFSKRNYRQALDYYNRSIHLTPAFHKPYNNRGLIYLNSGDYQLAIENFSKVIELNPKDAAIAYNNRGYAYMNLSDYETALADYSRAIKLAPHYQTALINRANLNSYLDRNGLAIKDYTAAIDVNPRYVNAYYNRGRALYRLGEKQKAMKDFQKALELNPQHEGTLRFLKRLQITPQQPAEAK